MATIKKYNGLTWENTIARKYETKSEIIVPPTTIYADGNNITTYSIKGNTVQNGTPTPTSPIAVNGVGELVGSDYQIPISSGQASAVNYLGSVQTTRQIKKQILTGTEMVLYNGNEPSNRIMVVTLLTNETGTNTPSNVICTHFETKNTVVQTSSGGIAMRSNGIDFVIGIGYDIINVDSDSTPVAVQNAFKAYLAAQYAVGTPVTVWYVLATPETAAVNEPLMKIGTYADTLSNATAIPTTEGANSITVDTTVQPSKFTATWTGWHNANVKKWDGSDWN